MLTTSIYHFFLTPTIGNIKSSLTLIWTLKHSNSMLTIFIEVSSKHGKLNQSNPNWDRPGLEVMQFCQHGSSTPKRECYWRSIWMSAMEWMLNFSVLKKWERMWQLNAVETNHSLEEVWVVELHLCHRRECLLQMDSFSTLHLLTPIITTIEF
jgi:hypothetical protein